MGLEIRETLVQQARTLIESLSLGSGAILIAVLSVVAVWFLCSVLPRALHPLWVVVVPFLLACSLYWLPVWLGADSSEYSAWVLLGVGAWFFAGFFPSAVLVLILRKRSSR